MSLYESVLITGGGGMVAHALGDLLRGRGTVALLGRAELDVADDASLVAAFEKYRPRLVLNCAAHTKVDLCEAEEAKATATNGRAVGKMAELCARGGAILVQISTDFVFDGKSERPYRVDDAVNPLSAYGRSKLAGETAMKASPLKDWLIVRTAWVYGRHGANFPRTMVTAARAGKPLAVIDDQIGSPTYAPDLAEGIVALLDAKKRGVWHFTNSGQTSWRGFAAAALEAFGIDAPVGALSSAQWREMRPASAVRPAYSVLDTEDYISATGRVPRAWREALLDFHAAVEKHGWD